MQDYREEVRQTKLAVDDPNNLSADMVPGVRTAASYVGTDKCLACHPSRGGGLGRFRPRARFQDVD